MCVAVPGRVLSIDKGIANVDFDGNVVRAAIGLVKAQPGDYVLVHAGCAIEVMKKEAADELMALLKDLEEVMQDGT